MRGGGGRGGQGVKINKGSEIFFEFSKWGGGGQNKQGGVGISKYPLMSVMNEKRDINVYY